MKKMGIDIDKTIIKTNSRAVAKEEAEKKGR